MLRHSALATDVQHRALGAEGRSDAGDRVGAAGAGRGHDDAELACLPCVAVGRMRRHLLVAHIDDADALIDAAVVDVDDVASTQREDGVHALVLERLGDQVSAGNHAGITTLPLERVLGGGAGRLRPGGNDC